MAHAAQQRVLVPETASLHSDQERTPASEPNATERKAWFELPEDFDGLDAETIEDRLHRITARRDHCAVIGAGERFSGGPGYPAEQGGGVVLAGLGTTQQGRIADRRKPVGLAMTARVRASDGNQDVAID